MGLAAALAAQALASQTPDPKRIDAIWQAASARMYDQNDAWFEQGDYPRIVQLLRYMHSLWPTDYDTATNLGWMLENIDRTDEALALYIAYRKDNPNLYIAAFPEANFYFKNKLYSKVPPLLEPHLGLHASANMFRLVAHSYEKMNLLKDSMRTWEKYIALAPGDLAAKQNEARIERKLKDGAKSVP